MKKLLGILVLGLLFISAPSQADDIRDFQIEGMSVGDSLLDYMTKNEIKQNTLQYFPDQRKYYIVGMINNLKSFEQVEIYLKSKDKKYEIRSMAGMLMINNLKNCLKKKKKIIKDIDHLFSELIKFSSSKSHEADESGKSKQYIDQYNFEAATLSNHIRVECVIWTNKIKQEKGFEDTLNVVAMTNEVWNWVASGYR